MHIASGPLFSYILVNLLVATVFVPVPVNLAYELTCQPEGALSSIRYTLHRRLITDSYP